MILEEDEIIQLVKDPVNPVIKVNRDLQDDHKVHIQGTGFEDVLQQIIGYENVEQFRQKKLLTKPFTRPIIKKIKSAQSRWKTAQGTSKFYEFAKKSEKTTEEFEKQILSQVWKGSSIDNFIKKFASNVIYEEFNGFFLVERGKIETDDTGTYEVREGIRKKVEGNYKAKPYIIFISVDELYNFKLTGKRVEFLVLKFGKIKRGNNEIELFRVIDDVNDYIVEKEGDKVKISEEYPVIEHKVGQCPALNITSTNKFLTNDNTKTSPIDDIIELLDYYLHQFAEHLVSEVLHAHPLYYQLGQKCMHQLNGGKCDDGSIIYEEDGENKEVICPACKGLGVNLRKDASSVINLPLSDQQTGESRNITNVAGYIHPDVAILGYQQKAIDWMEQKILDSALGVNNTTQTESLLKTATGAMINVKPLEDIISDIIDVIEEVETTLTDFIGKTHYGDKYKRSEIIYGRKLNLRDESALLTEIKLSKESGSSNYHLKTLNEELTYSRFIRSKYDLQRAKILNELEPLIGFTFEEIESSQSIPKKVKILKQNFVDFIQRFEIENMPIQDFKPEMEFNKKVLEISKILDGYASEAEIETAPIVEPIIDKNGTD